MRKVIPNIIIIVFLTACTSFIKDEQMPELKKYQDIGYITKKEITAGQKSIPAGKKIKIIIKISNDWIKVYGYDYNVPILQSERTLILYMFQEDFPNKKFSKDFFMQKLSQFVKPVGKSK